jgi:hypothetical protein
MLSPSTLERVSVSYRRGYYDGYDGKSVDNPERDPFDHPFTNFDYDQGYKAGANDHKRADERALLVDVKANLTPRELAAERAAARIKKLVNPSHSDYKRVIDEEYKRVGL